MMSGSVISFSLLLPEIRRQSDVVVGTKELKVGMFKEKMVRGELST